MMKLIKFFIVGILFGIVLTKSEAVSWYRIYEMFKFESFHMYGIISIAVITGIIGIQLINYFKIKDYKGNSINIPKKEKNIVRYIAGGVLFGLGWGLVGACPGPIFILLGTGIIGIIVVFIGTLVGTFLYGIVKDKLPH